MPKGEITHVEFPAADAARAKRFYSAVVGWEFGEMEAFPDYHLFSVGPNQGGAVARRWREGAGPRVFITVDSLEEACATAEANGGRILEPPSDIGAGMGRSAVLLDTEGNEVGLWQAPPAAGG